MNDLRDEIGNNVHAIFTLTSTPTFIKDILIQTPPIPADEHSPIVAFHLPTNSEENRILNIHVTKVASPHLSISPPHIPLS